MTEYVREINGVLKDHQDMWDVTELITETGELAGASCLQAASAFSLGIDAEAGRADDFANRPLSARLAGASCLQAASAFSLGIDAEASGCFRFQPRH